MAAKYIMYTAKFY